MNIAVYYDLPNGGAKKTMDSLLPLLSKKNKISVFHTPRETDIFSKYRLGKDLESILLQSIKQKMLAKKIDDQQFDLVFVTHDKHLQAPHLLRFLNTKTVFLCQEPTRAFFEHFLSIDKSLVWYKYLYEKINRCIRKYLEIMNAQKAVRILSNSHYSSEAIFRAYGVRSYPVYLGLHRKDFSFTGDNKRKNQVIIIGNNEPQKALGFAIKVISHIKPKKRPTLLIACPRDNNMQSIIDLAKMSSVKIKIKIGLTSQELAHEYRQSIATLAVAHLEPFGLSVIESMASKTPVLGVGEGGFRETIIDGVDGFILPRDEKRFADKLIYLQNHPKVIDKMGKAGAKKVNKFFTWKITAQRIQDHFNEI